LTMQDKGGSLMSLLYNQLRLKEMILESFVRHSAVRQAAYR